MAASASLKQAAIAGSRGCCAACLSRRSSIGSTAAGIAYLTCGRFHAHGHHSLLAGPAAIGPRLHHPSPFPSSHLTQVIDTLSQEEKRPRWGVRTSNPRKDCLPVLGGFDSHSLPPVLCSRPFSGVHPRSIVWRIMLKKTRYFPRFCLYTFVAVRVPEVGCSSATARTTESRFFDQNGTFIAQWFQFGRPSGMCIDKDDVIYVADSECRTNTGQLTLPQTGLDITLARTRDSNRQRGGQFRPVLHSRCMSISVPVRLKHGEGITADFEGNVYGADFLGDARKFIRK
jgi:hypothetical protein